MGRSVKKERARHEPRSCRARGGDHARPALLLGELERFEEPLGVPGVQVLLGRNPYEDETVTDLEHPAHRVAVPGPRELELEPRVRAQGDLAEGPELPAAPAGDGVDLLLEH